MMYPYENYSKLFNSYPSAQNGHKIMDNFKCNFVNDNLLFSIIFSWKSVPWGVVDEKSTLI